MQKQSHDLEEGQRAKAREKSPGLQTSDEICHTLPALYVVRMRKLAPGEGK